MPPADPAPTAPQFLRIDDALPVEDWRDRINLWRLDAKFRWPPFRAYYRWRAWKYRLYRTPELGLLRHLVDPRRTAVDVGANLGLVTYWLARYARRVHAFEPNPLPLRVLRHVVDANVTLHAAAVGDGAGTVDLMIHKGRKGWTSNGAKISGTVTGRAAVVAVPLVRLDDLPIDDVGFLKVDVEGHEASVLAGADRILRRDRPTVMLECEHLHLGDRMGEVFQRMHELKYQGFALVDSVLKTLRHFDVERHQIATDARGGTRPDYVRNFFFLAD